MQEEFSQLLKIARKEAGYTQKELAEVLGVATGTVQQWELGTRFPRVGMLKSIEQTLKIALVPEDIDKEKQSKREKTMLNAWKAAEAKAGKKLSFDEAMEYYKFETAVFVRLDEAIKKLNNEGRKVALERIEELTLIDKYTLPDINRVIQEKRPETAPETLFNDGEYRDTNKKEKPPEGQISPTDGNKEDNA